MSNDKNNFSELFEQTVPSSESEKEEKNSAAQSNEKPEVPHVSRKFAITVISVFAAFLLLPTLLWGALKIANIFNPNIMETINFDTGENRAFAKFPTSFNAKTVTSDIESWYNDNLPFRSVLFGANRTIEGKLELPYQNTIQPALIQLFHGSDTPSDPVGGGAISLDKEPEQTNKPEETVPQYENDDAPTDCEHEFPTESVTVSEPTCSEFGVIGYTCLKCGFEKKEYTQKLEHTYVSNAAQHASRFKCGTNYDEKLTCTACGDSYSQKNQKKHVQGKVVEKVGSSYKDYGYTLVECANCGTLYRTELFDKLYNTNYFPTTLRGGTILGRDGWFFQNAVMPYYTGSNSLNTPQLKEYTQTFSKLNEICKSKDIELLISIWPNKEMVYPEYMPTLERLPDEQRRVPQLVDYVRKNSDVNIIYPLEELLAAKPYWELYLPLDTHWNRAGGFVGYQAMMKALGLETTDPLNVPFTQVTGLYVGGYDLLRGAGFDINNYEPQKNYNFNYRPNVKVTLTPTNEQHDAVSYPTYSRSVGATYDKNVVLIGDSYRIMHCPYAERDFSDYSTGHKIYLDRGKAEDIAFHQKIKEADILIITSVERLDYELLTAAQSLIKILSN